MANWVYRVSDGQLMIGGPPHDPSIYLTDQVNYAQLSLPDAVSPNARTQRYETATSVRAATAEEITAYDQAVADATALSARTDKDRLAMLATMAEAYNPAWATMTNAQRREEVVRLSKRWEQQRNWVTRNVALMVW